MFRIAFILAILPGFPAIFGQPICNYKDSLPVYVNLLKADSFNTILNYKIGLCYLNSRSKKERAINYFEKALSVPPVPINVYKCYGEACQAAYKFDKAILAYADFLKLFRKSNNKDSTVIEEVNRDIALCRFGNKLNLLMDYKAKNPVKDEQYFSSGNDTAKRETKNHTPCNLSDSVRNEATVATSGDGQMILIYKDDGGEGNLFVSGLKGNEWTLPEKLNEPLNLQGWEQDEFLSTDGYTLYFSSDREGGFGGKDIYKCKKLTNGEWGKAINLGPEVNSPYDEEAPVIYPDGVTLFYSSNRINAGCSFDVFSSTLINDRTWTEPVNIGYPIKPMLNDTVRNQKSNYKVTFVSQKDFPVNVIKGTIPRLTGKGGKRLEIVITDNESGETLSVYQMNAGKEDYLFILPPGRNNLITYDTEGYLFCSENTCKLKETNYYEEIKAVELVPIHAGSKAGLNNIMFDSSKAELSMTSKVELLNLLHLLNKYPNMTIQVSDYIYSTENSKLNKKLAQDRAEALINYLADKGICKDRMYAKGDVLSHLNPVMVELKILNVN